MGFRIGWLVGSVPLLATAAIMACSSSTSDAVDEDGGAQADARDAPSVETSSSTDAGPSPVDAGPDGACFITTDGVYGTCLTTTDCAALGAYTSTPGFCPGSADIQCCSRTPNVADNPPVPAGWKLMQQSEVTPDMTTWAVFILQHPVTYPMFSTTFQMFGALNVMARVEWHPPDFQNGQIHRGVTLYEPTD